VGQTTHSGTPFYPALLKNVGDSFNSGSVYHHGDDNVNDDEDETPRNPIELPNRSVGAPGDSNNNTSYVGLGRGCGRCRGGRSRGVATGRGHGRAPLQEENYTGTKVAFPPDTTLWP
jgi:hypothetical protein